MKTCADFAESFLSIICNMAKDYDEVRVVFDRYLTPSLKSQTRRKRNQRKTTYLLSYQRQHTHQEHFSQRFPI